MPLPQVSPRWFEVFGRYVERYLRRHLHRVRLSRAGLQSLDVLEGAPVVVYLNHPSWWDPLLCLLLARRQFGHRPCYGAIEAAALERYGFFRKLGFFGVEQGTTAGARRFLQVSEALLEESATMLWLTPQGRFADPRSRPVELERGLGHLARRLGEGHYLPLALEYPFWEERTAEALVRFGEPLAARQVRELRPRQVTERLARRLEATQDALAAEAVARRPTDFESLVSGRAGVGGLYDLWRRWKARLRGESFDAEHGEL